MNNKYVSADHVKPLKESLEPFKKSNCSKEPIREIDSDFLVGSFQATPLTHSHMMQPGSNAFNVSVQRINKRSAVSIQN